MKKLVFVIILISSFILISCKEGQVSEKLNDTSIDSKINLESKQELNEKNQEQQEDLDEKLSDMSIERENNSECKQEQQEDLNENCVDNKELIDYKEIIKNDIALCYESLDINDYSEENWNKINNLYHCFVNQIDEYNSQEYLYAEKNRIICQIRSISPKCLTNDYILKSFDLEDNKVYWKGTIDDVFPDNLIIVVLKKPINYIELSVENFGLEKAVSIKYSGGVTPPDYMFKKEYEYLLNDFRQIIFIRLEPLGKEKVIEAIRKLEQLEFVKSVQPDVALEPVE